MFCLVIVLVFVFLFPPVETFFCLMLWAFIENVLKYYPNVHTDLGYKVGNPGVCFWGLPAFYDPCLEWKLCTAETGKIRPLVYCHSLKRLSHGAYKEETVGELGFRKVSAGRDIPKARHAVFGAPILQSCQKSSSQWLLILKAHIGYVSCWPTQELSVQHILKSFWDFLSFIWINAWRMAEDEVKISKPNVKEVGVKILPFFSSIVILIRQPVKPRRTIMTL